MMEQATLEILTRPFPPEQIRQREGRGGKMLDYLETHAVITRLNEAFSGAWSFEIVDYKTMEGEIVVHGKLTAGGQVKAQFGSAEIHRTRGENGEIGLHLYEKGGAQHPQEGRQQRPAQQADRRPGQGQNGQQRPGSGRSYTPQG